MGIYEKGSELMENKRTIMAIGAHIGDMELSAGGVLSTMALQGHKIIIVSLTGGEKGNPKGMTTADYRVQKLAEAKQFAQMLGGESIVFNIPDGDICLTEELKFQLCDIIREHKPNVLITHWKHSMHKDHIATHKIVKDAQFYAGLPGYIREREAHFAGGPYYAENWEDPEAFSPYVYVEVTTQGFKLWEKAISLHWFTINSTSFKYKEYYSHLMTTRGILARKPYAQAFDIDFDMKKVVKDIL